MKCNQDMVLLYHSNELDEETRKEMQIHLQNCSACNAWYEEISMLDEIFSDLPELVHDKPLKVLSTPVKKAADSKVYSWWNFPIPSWFAGCAVGLCALLIWNMPTQEQRSSRLIVKQSAIQSSDSSFSSDLRQIKERVRTAGITGQSKSSRVVNRFASDSTTKRIRSLSREIYSVKKNFDPDHENQKKPFFNKRRLI